MPKSLKAEFFTKSANCEDFLELFNHLSNVSFFIKNASFQIVAANRNFFARLGFDEESKIIGKEDYELFPKPLATKFRKDDERVLATGTTMLQMVEMFLNRHGLPDWFMTHKMPVRDSTGQTIGIMGTVERYNQEKALKSADPAIAKAVEKLLSRPETFSSVSELAREAGMSQRHFNRRFKEETSLTPSQFLGRCRIQLACQLLRSEREKNISDIALEIGFCDQSAFTTQFRERMGTTPFKYRQAY